MGVDQPSRVNNWGVVAVICVFGALVTDAFTTARALQSRAFGVPVFVLVLLSIICSVVAARRGRRWWFVSTCVACVLLSESVLGLIGE
jgi:MFS-type transporter involved in bile tolerance (Atg22 family)